MSKWMQYSEIKKLINQYCVFHDEKKYDEFIRKLVEILEI